MKNFYVTFGSNHGVGLRHYIRIVAKDYSTARKIVVDNFNDKWAFLYTEEEKEEAIDRFNMVELNVLS